MRRSVLLVATVLLLVMTAACAVPLPRSDNEVARPAVDHDKAHKIFQRYVKVRETASELLDAKPLSVVETDPVLSIDAGSFEIAQKSAQHSDSSDKPELKNVYAPRLKKYPLWFVARIREPVSRVERIAVFERASSTQSWQMIESPQILANTTFPQLRQSETGLVTVEPDASRGLSMSPQQAADLFADALTDSESEEAEMLSGDSFIQQMRQSAKEESDLDEVKFSQKWKALDVHHAARAQDGGAIAWATLERADSYHVTSGKKVTWPDGSPQQAFLGEGIKGTGALRYYHQVLLYVPDEGKPRALGHYGGVTGADADDDADDDQERGADSR